MRASTSTRYAAEWKKFETTFPPLAVEPQSRRLSAGVLSRTDTENSLDVCLIPWSGVIAFVEVFVSE